VPAPPTGGSSSGSGGFGPTSGGQPAGGGGSGGRSLGPLLIGIAAVALVIAAVAAVLTLGGDDDPGTEAGGDTTVATNPATTAPPSTEAEQTTTTAAASDDPYVQIDSVELQDDQYVVNFTIQGFTPSFADGSYHTHFFLNDIEPDNAGANGNPPGDWALTDETSSFATGYGPADHSTRSFDQICALVADSHHNVAFQGTTTGNCVDLPQAG
jgi:hypothetical protein